jgi:two-component system, cell cycle response regulator DivK
MTAGKQLLIVEDDANSREGYRMYLSGAGFDVHTLAGGSHAVDFVRTATPDLVVLDLGLPDLDGWEVARRLKSDEQTKRIPIIAFSGRSMQHEQVSALRAGCDVYLTKPCPPDRLLTTIKKLLGMTPATADRRAEPLDPY